jgi:SAM-dependent methyltransferase
MDLRSTIKRYVPRRAIPVARAVYRRYMRILSWYVGQRDRRYTDKSEFAHLPPAPLRYRVHGSPYAEGFLNMGKRCSEDIEAALKKVGKDFDSFQNVLDFGCGCGRTLVWFTGRSPHLYGTDIDAEAISWCRSNLAPAEFNVNSSLPPLEYPSETFDLIYAISVFTHLDEDYQFRWLNELKRVTKPGGVVLLTVHGHYAWKALPHKDVVDIEREGFKFISSNAMKGIFPEWYQNAYHKKEYIFERYPKYFNILDYIPRGMSNLHDAVVLQKPR